MSYHIVVSLGYRNSIIALLQTLSLCLLILYLLGLRTYYSNVNDS